MLINIPHIIYLFLFHEYPSHIPLIFLKGAQQRNQPSPAPLDDFAPPQRPAQVQALRLGNRGTVVPCHGQSYVNIG